MKSDYVTKSYENDHFILNLNNLQLGDIILEHGYKPHSIAICKATKSHYSHAMIYAGHTIIEATSHGRVYSRIPNRIFVHNQNDIKVLRLREKTPDTILEKIVTEAKLLTGTKYSLKEAILVLNSTEKQNLNLTRKQFCSRLVAQCYSSAGIDIVKNNSYCSPQDINLSNKLHSIPNVVRLASIDEINFLHSNSSHTHHVDVAAKFVELSIKALAFRGITTVFIENVNVKIESINEIYFAVMENKYNSSLDNEIALIMENTGYMDGPFDDEKSNPYRYSELMFHEKYDKFSEDEKEFYLSQELNKEISCLKHRIDNYNASLYNRQSKLKTFENVFIINKNMLETMYKRVCVIYDYCLNNIHTPFMVKYMCSSKKIMDIIENTLK